MTYYFVVSTAFLGMIMIVIFRNKLSVFLEESFQNSSFKKTRLLPKSPRPVQHKKGMTLGEILRNDLNYNSIEPSGAFEWVKKYFEGMKKEDAYTVSSYENELTVHMDKMYKLDFDTKDRIWRLRTPEKYTR